MAYFAWSTRCQLLGDTHHLLGDQHCTLDEVVSQRQLLGVVSDELDRLSLQVSGEER